MTTFYLDESGHSGDVVNRSDSNQPFFVSAAVGFAAKEAIDSRIHQLRRQHNIQGTELKSKSLVSKPKFVAEVIKELCDSDIPIFVELVDKRYFICANIASFNVLAPCMGYEEGAKLTFLRNTLADFLYFEADETLLDAFIKSCLEPSTSTLMATFSEITKLTRQCQKEPLKRDIAKGLLQMIEAAQAEHEECLQTDSAAYRNFLPPPDSSKNNKDVWMLPQLTSFTNIYARMNRFYGGKLKGLHIVHDEQLQVDEILRRGKAMAESLRKEDRLPFTPASNFVFKENATFEFAKSQDELGIQLADVLAGAVMRYYRDRSKTSINHDLEQAMQMLLDQSDAETGCGINQVVPSLNVL